LVLFLSAAITLLGAAGCNWDPVWKQAPYKDEVVYYEADLGLYNRTDEITREQAEKLEAYFVGYFDENSRIYRTENYFRGELVYGVSYTYYRDGQLKSQEMTRGDGRSEVFEFDPTGRLIAE